MKNRLILNGNIQNLSINSTVYLTKNKSKSKLCCEGELDEYIFPQKSKPQRVNELWKATCFELFLANSKKEEYYELNFSSSLAWNFYYLTYYRANVQEVQVLSEPKMEVHQKDDMFQIDFELEIEGLEAFDIYNVASIFLSKEKERTFWSAQHEKNVPDFHNRATFLEIK